MKKTIILIFLLVSLSSQANWKVEFLNVGNLKNSISQQIKDVPYSNENQNAFREYFISLKFLAAKANDSKIENKKFNKTIMSLGISEFCHDILLDYNDYETLVENCTQNSFFLCAEILRDYNVIFNDLKSALDDETLKEFSSIVGCKIFN